MTIWTAIRSIMSYRQEYKLALQLVMSDNRAVVRLTTHNTPPVVLSVTHCILGKPDQFRVTCPSIRKSNISQSAYYAKNTQDLSTKRRHLS